MDEVGGGGMWPGEDWRVGWIIVPALCSPLPAPVRRLYSFFWSYYFVTPSPVPGCTSSFLDSGLGYLACLGQWDAHRCDTGRGAERLEMYLCSWPCSLLLLPPPGEGHALPVPGGGEEARGAEPAGMTAEWGRAPPAQTSLDQLSPSWPTDSGGHTIIILSHWV